MQEVRHLPRSCQLLCALGPLTTHTRGTERFPKAVTSQTFMGIGMTWESLQH